MDYNAHSGHRSGCVARRAVAPYRAILLVIGLHALTACVPPSVVKYTSFQDRDFSQRPKPAEIQQKTTAELLDSGHLLIGYIDLRRNMRTCYEDGKCVNHSDPTPSRDDLRQEAAQRGGDVITLLEERTVLERNDKSYCTNTSTTVVMVNKIPQTITTCISYQTVAGKLEARISRALIWRHDPEAARGEENARAIAAALKTLESESRADESGRSSSSGSFLGDLFGGPGKKEETPGQGVDALSKQVYQAIGSNDSGALYALAREGKLQAWSDSKGRSALMIALIAERPEAARTLLAIDKGLARRDGQGLNAMHYAVARANLPLVRELAKAGYDLHAKARDDTTLLFYALFNNSTEILDWLLTQGLEARARTSKGETTLMVAAGIGRETLLQRFLELGVAVNERDQDGRTALMNAARSGRREAVQVLLKARARAEAVDYLGNGVLHYAAVGGSRDVMHALTPRGTNLNVENKQGITPLATALSAQQWEAARFLIDRGASLTTNKITAEESAAYLISKNQPELLKPYLASFPALKELLQRDPEWLQHAARKSGRATIRFMADLGARVDRPGNDGLTPLMTAASAGNDEAVRALLELKADPTVRDRRGQTALRMGTLNGHTNVVEAMREFGVVD